MTNNKDMQYYFALIWHSSRIYSRSYSLVIFSHNNMESLIWGSLPEVLSFPSYYTPLA